MELDAQTFERIHPVVFHHKFLQEKVRCDGRGLMEYRPVVCTPGVVKSAQGSCMVKVGDTLVTCGLTLEVMTPESKTPSEGRIEVAVHSQPFKVRGQSGKQASEWEIQVSEYLLQMLLSTETVALSDLCISEGKAVWCVYADIVLCNWDGNAMDAAATALVSGFESLRIPAVEILDSGSVVLAPAGPDGKRQEQAMPVMHALVPSTFALIDEFVVLDPSSNEEGVASGFVTIIFNEKLKLCSVYKPGGIAIGIQKMRKCIQVAKNRAMQRNKSANKSS
jgi:exosome complex component RRP43